MHRPLCVEPRFDVLAGRARGATVCGMTAQGQVVLRDALQLPPEERADIAAELLASLEEAAEPHEVVETAWAEEIERRARRVLAGETDGTPWPEVRDRLEKRLKSRG